MRRSLGWFLFLVTFAVPAVSTAATPLRCSEPIPEIFRRVSPSVVFISAVAVDPSQPTAQLTTVVGSGFIISGDGLVLTNSHVVFGYRAVTVSRADGRQIEAKLLGADPIWDLAVLRIPAPPGGLPQATLGDSDSIQVGEEVVAVGNPFGLEQTLTRGVISGVSHGLADTPTSLAIPLLQTDAPINPGNSGGPLLNRCGEVIGINTSVLVEAQNIGFAIPINIATRFLPQLVEKGHIVRPWLGVGGRVIGSELEEMMKMPLVNGFLVETIDAGSPAEQAGLHVGNLPISIAGDDFLLGGDIITVANGQPLNDPEKFTKFARSLKVGDTVRLTLYYKGETREVEFRLPERPLLPGDLPSDSGRRMSPLRGRRPASHVRAPSDLRKGGLRPAGRRGSPS